MQLRPFPKYPGLQTHTGLLLTIEQIEFGPQGANEDTVTAKPAPVHVYKDVQSKLVSTCPTFKK